MARRGRPSVINDLLEHYTTKHGYNRYSTRASDITDEQLEKMIDVANNRLYQLERTTYSEDSQGYQTIKRYATSNDLTDNKYYKYNEDKDTIRIKKLKDLEFDTKEDKRAFINKVRDILNYQTGTIAGVKAAIEKGFYGTYLPEMQFKDKTKKLKIKKDEQYWSEFEKYRKLWKIYRATNKDKHEKAKSDAVYNAMLNRDFYGMTRSQQEHAMKIFNNYEVKEAESQLQKYKDQIKKDKEKETLKRKGNI